MTLGQYEPTSIAVERRPVPRDDSSLWEALVHGDGSALHELYDRHGAHCFALALQLLAHDMAGAERVVDEVFGLLGRSVQGGHPDARMWLFGQIRRCCLDARSGMRSDDDIRSSADGQYGSTSKGSELPPTAATHQLKVSQALSILPQEFRQSVELAYFEGLTLAEIAARTDTSPEVVRRQMRLGLHQLRVELARAGVGGA